MKTKYHQSWQQHCRVTQHPSLHPSAVDWPHTVPFLASLPYSLISQSLPGHVVSRSHRLWLVHSHHSGCFWWAQLSDGGRRLRCPWWLLSPAQWLPPAPHTPQGSPGKQGMHSSPIPGLPSVPSVGCQSFIESAIFLSIKKYKLQAALISFTEVTTEAPAVYVQRIFLNFLIFQKFIPPCLNQREESWASWHLSQPLH